MDKNASENFSGRWFCIGNIGRPPTAAHQCGRLIAAAESYDPQIYGGASTSTLPPLFPEKRLFGIGRRVGAEAETKGGITRLFARIDPTDKMAQYIKTGESLQPHGADEAVCRNGPKPTLSAWRDRLPASLGTTMLKFRQLHPDDPNYTSKYKQWRRKTLCKPTKPRRKTRKRLFCGTVEKCPPKKKKKARPQPRPKPKATPPTWTRRRAKLKTRQGCRQAGRRLHGIAPRVRRVQGRRGIPRPSMPPHRTPARIPAAVFRFLNFKRQAYAAPTPPYINAVHKATARQPKAWWPHFNVTPAVSPKNARSRPPESTFFKKSTSSQQEIAGAIIGLATGLNASRTDAKRATARYAATRNLPQPHRPPYLAKKSISTQWWAMTHGRVAVHPDYIKLINNHWLSLKP
ncbi:Presumed capsid scaffolding protein GpO [Neisseria meningitidis]|nr:Presumed capsid scaffolding protein GpO [Neisseria meningitidis]